MSSERVVQHLLERDWVSEAQIAEAKRTQQSVGGQVLSHLLRLGFVDEERLGRAMHAVWDVPFADRETLRAVPPEARDRLPRELARKHRCCPIGQDERLLELAMLNPRDSVAIREVESVTDMRVRPWVTTEHRLSQALERFYRVSPGGGTAEVGLDGLPLDADPSEAHLLFHGGDPFSDASPNPATEAPRQEDGFDALEETLCQPGDRDAVTSAVLRFLAARGARAAVFAVAGGGIRGIAASGRGVERAVRRGFSLGSEEPTIFHNALESRDFYFGPVPPLPANRDVYSVLGGRIPPDVLLLPVRVQRRTVALLYLDNDSTPLERPDIPMLRRVAAKVGLSYEMLILRNKLRSI